MLEDKEKKIPATFYPQGFFFRLIEINMVRNCLEKERGWIDKN
jgi:hypothetical protein